MKRFVRACITLFGCYLIHKVGYVSGWLDGSKEIMVENDIKEYTKTFKDGTQVTVKTTKNN